jgi:ABC-type branched-subunit amino acid transport system substrate-binding protein
VSGAVRSKGNIKRKKIKMVRRYSGMRRSKMTAIIAGGLCLVFAFGIMLTGCGGSGGSGDSGDSSNADNVIKVVSVSPLTGVQAPFGAMMKMGAELAIEEKKAEIEDLGFQVQFMPQDDSADPKMGVAMAQKIGRASCRERV